MKDLCTDVEKFGKGIGSVPRYRIIEALMCGPKTVSELVKKTKLSQPLVSQHLRTLKETDLVTDKREGQEVFYALNALHMVKLLEKLTTALQGDTKQSKKKLAKK